MRKGEGTKEGKVRKDGLKVKEGRTGYERSRH
jgi:hypothetical protein